MKATREGGDLWILMASLKPEGYEVALDVAADTVFTSMGLAKHVKRVVALDITPEMLLEAERIACERGSTGILFEHGDALNTPNPDGVFDLVTTRRAAHHFPSIQKFLYESHRVLSGGGRLAGYR